MKRLPIILFFVFLTLTPAIAESDQKSKTLYVPTSDTSTVRLKIGQTIPVYTASKLRRITGADFSLYGLDAIEYSIREHKGLTLRYDQRNEPVFEVQASDAADTVSLTFTTEKREYNLRFRVAAQPPFHTEVQLGKKAPQTLSNTVHVLRVEPGQALDESTWGAIETILAETYPRKPYHYSLTPYLGVVVLNKGETGDQALKKITNELKKRDVPYEINTLPNEGYELDTEEGQKENRGTPIPGPDPSSST